MDTRIFEMLPSELVWIISYNFTINSALHVCKVTPTIEYCNNDTYWQYLVNKTFGSLIPNSGETWKSLAVRYAKYEYLSVNEQIKLTIYNFDEEAFVFLSEGVIDDDLYDILYDVLDEAIENDNTKIVKFINKIFAMYNE